MPRRLIVSEFLTLDGVMEAPGFDEHRDGRNAWALRRQSAELQRKLADQYDQVDAILLGRTTYQIWAAFWPTMSQDEPFARRLTEMDKYVVSGTIAEATWSNTHVLGSDWLARVAELKAEDGRGILVTGSADVVNALMEHDLVDEYQLLLFPVVLGSGKHLFRDKIATQHMTLIESRSFDSGVVMLTYRPQSDAPTSEYFDNYSWTDEQIRSLHAAENVDRVLATVMFTDIVGSTERAAALGDRRWRQLMDHHDEAARAEVDRWHGQLIKSTGDGILATFDTPTRALRCAFGLEEALHSLELHIRAGIHTGEVEVRDGDVTGIAVHIASRALDEATEVGVVVTRTVRDLASGADLVFSPLGSVGLRGIPGQWELFEVSTSSAPSPHRASS